MAIRNLTYQSASGINVVPCEEVLICLADGWEDNTVSGTKVVIGKVLHGARQLGIRTPLDTLLFNNPRGLPTIQYSISIDDAQFNEGFFPSCGDITKISEKSCIPEAPAE